MKLRWAALTVVLALSALMPRSSHAQTAGQPPAGRRAGSLGQNYPNPFNPETRIPFAVDSLCADPGRTYRVTLRIFNLIGQVVATPQLLGVGSGGAGAGQPLENVTLSCGERRAPGRPPRPASERARADVVAARSTRTRTPRWPATGAFVSCGAAARRLLHGARGVVPRRRGPRARPARRLPFGRARGGGPANAPDPGGTSLAPSRS